MKTTMISAPASRCRTGNCSSAPAASCIALANKRRPSRCGCGFFQEPPEAFHDFGLFLERHERGQLAVNLREAEFAALFFQNAAHVNPILIAPGKTFMHHEVLGTASSAASKSGSRLSGIGKTAGKGKGENSVVAGS